MKRFFEIVIPIKTAVSFCFTGAVFFLLVAAWCLGWDSVPLPYLVSLLLAAVAGGVLQVVAFTDAFFKNLAYTKRMLVFILPFLPILSAIAVCFHWFPADQAGAWGLFVAIFLAAFLVMSLGFELLFHFTGKKYDGLLGQYRKRRSQ